MGKPRTSGRTWQERLTPLVGAPGWHLLASYDTENAAAVAASNLRRGATKLPEGNWKFLSRPAGPGAPADEAAYLYARWFGNVA